MSVQVNPGSQASFTDEEILQNLWEEHMRCEFASRNTEDTLATMVKDAYVNHVSVITGGKNLTAQILYG